MFKRDRAKLFRKIRPNFHPKSTLDQIRFIFIATNCQEQLVQQFLINSNSIDFVFSDSSEANELIGCLEKSFPLINIKKSSFILVNNEFPNQMVKELDPNLEAKQICDSYLEFLIRYIREAFIEERPIIEGLDLEVTHLDFIEERSIIEGLHLEEINLDFIEERPIIEGLDLEVAHLEKKLDFIGPPETKDIRNRK